MVKHYKNGKTVFDAKDIAELLGVPAEVIAPEPSYTSRADRKYESTPDEALLRYARTSEAEVDSWIAAVAGHNERLKNAEAALASRVATRDEQYAALEARRICPACGDKMPLGFDLDDHFNCNWPEDFEGDKP